MAGRPVASATALALRREFSAKVTPVSATSGGACRSGVHHLGVDVEPWNLAPEKFAELLQLALIVCCQDEAWSPRESACRSRSFRQRLALDCGQLGGAEEGKIKQRIEFVAVERGHLLQFPELPQICPNR